MPTVWKIGIIKPIPKSSLLDPRVPLQYRGICLLSTVYKLFSGILNQRITKVADENALFVDEQNSFRKKRSCIDHIFTLTSIIRNRKAKRLPTYVAYIEFEKAFDRVDRNLLVHKLLSLGINGRIIESLKCIYNKCAAGINVNGYITDWFNTEYGVRQGDTLSPTLFGLYINDLVTELKNNTNGITCEEFIIQCLLYADDLVLISETEEDLQNMLHVLNDWCKKWRMKVNVSKSKIMHFRTTGHVESEYNFVLGNQSLEKVDKYKYLGVYLDTALDFEILSDTLAKAGGRALGAIVSKFKCNKGLGYKTYTKLFHAGVAPILDYCSGVWGYKRFDKINTIQNRAIRYFLGVHRFSPNLAINGDMGWKSCKNRREVEMGRFWNRMVTMNDDRLTKKVFLWDKQKCMRNWSSEIKEVLCSIGLEHAFMTNSPIDLKIMADSLHEKTSNTWCQEIFDVPKLRTYVCFKSNYCTENYVTNVTNRQHRSVLAQFRCGILPLKVETGRYQNIPLEYRLCIVCRENEIETESHFLLHCEKYKEIRDNFLMRLDGLYRLHPNFAMYCDGDKLKILMSDCYIKCTAKFIWQCFEKRRHCMYNTV